MSPRGLLVIGAAWFLAAAALGTYLGQASFAIGWIVKDRVSGAAYLAGFYLMFLFAVFILVGWVVPVGMGVYRLLRR